MKTTLINSFLWSVLAVAMISCNKSSILQNEPSKTPDGFSEFVILSGQHSTNHSTPGSSSYSKLSFAVKFDSSAIYQTTDPENQYDINKLYGFSDNGGHHQQFSARIGWRWSDGALALFGYIYNNGERSIEELGIIQIGKVYHCSVSVEENNYVFALDNHTLTMPRNSLGAAASGYKLYPYFGGDESAPHDIHIYIKEK